MDRNVNQLRSGPEARGDHHQRAGNQGRKQIFGHRSNAINSGNTRRGRGTGNGTGDNVQGTDGKRNIFGAGSDRRTVRSEGTVSCDGQADGRRSPEAEEIGEVPGRKAQGGDEVRFPMTDGPGGRVHGLGLGRMQEDCQEHERRNHQDRQPLHQVVELDTEVDHAE